MMKVMVETRVEEGEEEEGEDLEGEAGGEGDFEAL
jgi:hypothetical protein